MQDLLNIASEIDAAMQQENSNADRNIVSIPDVYSPKPLILERNLRADVTAGACSTNDPNPASN
jgi:hypothetical protein